MSKQNKIDSKKYNFLHKIYRYFSRKSTYKKMLYSAIFAFIFWLGFFGFCLVELSRELESNIYNILQYIIAILLIFTSIYIFMKYKIIESKNNVFFKAKYFKRDYEDKTQDMLIKASFNIKDSKIYIFYFLAVIICVIIFSILHKNQYFLSSIGYIISAAIFLFLPKKYRFYFGFFLGAFGFYWIALSFRFENLSSIIPLGVLGIALIYGILFYFLMYFNNVLFRILTCFSLFIIAPLTFNWLNVAYFSAYSVFSTHSLFVVLISLILLRTRFYFLSFVMLLFSFDYNFKSEDSKLNAQIVQTNYPQLMRFDSNFRDQIVNDNFNAIESAINNGYDMVILPESSFAFSLNKNEKIFQKLLLLSQKIIIVTGALRIQDSVQNTQDSIESNFISLDNLTDKSYKNNNFLNPVTKEVGYYNSTYIFAFNNALVADKIELVPFGETAPFEGILKAFGVKSGFNRGEKILTFEYKGLKFAIANCYEGSMSLPYKSGAKYILMGSNNAWFAPSTQHFMQKMIIKYYARYYDAFVYHATNFSPKYIISPNNANN